MKYIIPLVNAFGKVLKVDRSGAVLPRQGENEVGRPAKRLWQ